LELRTPLTEAQTPTWITGQSERLSELDALWDRYADRLATNVLAGHYDQRVLDEDGTPMEHAVRNIDAVFKSLATPEGQAFEIERDPAAEPFTEDDYARLDPSALRELARRAFEYLYREATS